MGYEPVKTTQSHRLALRRLLPLEQNEEAWKNFPEMRDDVFGQYLCDRCGVRRMTRGYCPRCWNVLFGAGAVCGGQSSIEYSSPRKGKSRRKFEGQIVETMELLRREFPFLGRAGLADPAWETDESPWQQNALRIWEDE